MFKYYNWIAQIINIYDHPHSKRKIHTKKTPLIGGVMLLVNIIFISTVYFFFKDIYYSDLNKIFRNYNEYFFFYFLL